MCYQFLCDCSLYHNFLNGNIKFKKTILFRFSIHKAFQSQLSEVIDIAGQHEIMAEEMIANINKALLNLCNDLELQKKKVNFLKLKS